VAGAARAWRKLSPLEAAYAKGQLAGGNPKFTAAQRFKAGNAMRRYLRRVKAAGATAPS
jgi:hypothetical protein